MPTCWRVWRLDLTRPEWLPLVAVCRYPLSPMAIPDFQSLMLPVLRASEQGEVRIGDVVETLANQLGLTDHELAELLPSGKQTTFANRVHWAKSYLGKAGLVALTRRAHFEITDRGRAVLANPPDRIDIAFLMGFAEFAGFRSDLAVKTKADPASDDAEPSADPLTPDERIRASRDVLEGELALDLLARVRAGSPAFFERSVVNLLTAMGYGGSAERAGKAIGKSGDGGVDGVIDEDALGLDRIYIQAKRYGPENPVGPSAIRDFFGALDQFKAGKGLFVTTSTFSASAIKTADNLSKRIVLIDGEALARLMIRYRVGCRLEETISILKVDEEFFD